MTAVEHLGQALRLLEAEASEIEQRMSFVRAAIEAFGLDADSLLMDVLAEEERADVEYWQGAKLRADAAGIPPVDVVAPTYDAPETAQQDDPDMPDWEAAPGYRVTPQTIDFLNKIKNPALRATSALWLLGTSWPFKVRPVSAAAAAL